MKGKERRRERKYKESAPNTNSTLEREEKRELVVNDSIKFSFGTFA